jgi:hypothetical protein
MQPEPQVAQFQRNSALSGDCIAEVAGATIKSEQTQRGICRVDQREWNCQSPGQIALAGRSVPAND